DIDETAGSLDALCPGDGDGWRRLHQLWDRVGEHLTGALFTPFPPVKAGLGLLAALPRGERLRFARFATITVRRLVEEEFNGGAAQRLLTGNALHADLSPESALSGLFGWLLASLGQSFGWPVPQGGSGLLAQALVGRIEDKGGSVTCAMPVTKVVVRGGRAVAVRTADGTEVGATKAVIADVDAPRLYLDLVGEEHLPARLLDDLTRFQWDWSTVKVDWNLDGPIPWSAEPARRAGTVHLVDSIDELTRTTAQLATSTIPDRPFLLVGQQSMTDPTRQPPGKETAWAYTHVPRKAKADAGGDLTGRWDAGEAGAFADRMQAQLEALAPGFESSIRGRHIYSPPGLHDHDGNLNNGAINGGTSQMHQQLVFRPVPGMGRPETPIPGLYLGSASAHPGGGVHGACGSNAARAAITGERLRRVGIRRGR
ncbi:MAG: hypothetical protein QOG64_2236, partial [Acidimicrobiaceae bacterium]|nr:hypothetical protein [Acidimicrobiaceae bacterium]